jgi:ribosome-binding factor A
MGKYRLNRINDAVVNEMAVILREVKDPRINSALVSVTGADVTADLKYAKIFFSVYGGDKDEVRRALQRAAGFFRSELARRINLRVTPELTFVLDRSGANGAHISSLLHKVQADSAERAARLGLNTDTSNESDEEGEE